MQPSALLRPALVVAVIAVLLTPAVRLFIACETSSCLRWKINAMLFTSLPYDYYKEWRSYLTIKPPNDCYLRFDEFPEHTRAMLRNVSLQVYDPKLTSSLKTRIPGPRTLPRLNVTIILIGTTGDVLPMSHVAKEFAARGHRVRVAAHHGFRNLFTSTPAIDFFPFDFEPRLHMEYGAVQKCLMTCDLPTGLKYLFYHLRMLLRLFQALDASDASGAPFRSDLLVVPSNAAGYELLAEWLQVPVHAFHYYPAAPTRLAPHAHAKVLEKPHWSEDDVLLSHAIAEGFPWVFMFGFMQLLRLYRGMPAVPFSPRSQALVPHFLLYSPALAPVYADWGDHVDVVGHAIRRAKADDGSGLSKELLEFLAAGETPLFVTFGSSLLDDPQAVTRTVVEALRRTGQRAVMQPGLSGFGTLPEGLPPSVYLLQGFTPHDVLLEHCKGAVHHAGSGTTQAVLLAQLPAVLIPLIADQPYWAERVEVTGVGRHVSFANMTAEALAEGIEFILREEVRERAREMGERMEKEDGATRAVDAVLEHLPADFAPGRKCVPWLRAPQEREWRC